MIRAARKDANHKEIAEYLIAHGASVGDLSQVKRLCDIVVGYKGVNELVEIKDGSKPPSQQKLTQGEQEFHDRYTGTISIVMSTDDADILLATMKAKSKALIKAGLLVIR